MVSDIITTTMQTPFSTSPAKSLVPGTGARCENKGGEPSVEREDQSAKQEAGGLQAEVDRFLGQKAVS